MELWNDFIIIFEGMKIFCFKKNIGRQKYFYANSEYSFSFFQRVLSARSTVKRSRAVQKVTKQISLRTEDCRKTQVNERLSRTFGAAMKIHCPPTEDKEVKEQSAKLGLYKTLDSKCSASELSKFLDSSKKGKQAVDLLTTACLSTEELHKLRLQRSVSTLYSGGLLSKSKYQSLRTMEKTQKMNVKLLPYKVLQSEIKRKHVVSLLVIQLPDISGCWRDFEKLLITVSQYYLSQTEFEVVWFQNSEGKILVIFGADGAPFGQNSTGTSFLIAFMNVMQRVWSCNHNFLVLGGNCDESSPAFLQYVSQLQEIMAKVEEKTYVVNDREISFEFAICASDQKWLASANGELNNNATYPSSFANVTKQNMDKVDGQFGVTWTKWDFETKLKDAKAVEEMKRKEEMKIRKKVGRGQKVEVPRNKITKFIADRKSRTEKQPPLGKYGMKCMVEPLHIMNLGWQHWYTDLLSFVKDKEDYLDKLLSIGAGKLHYKLKKFYSDTKGSQNLNIRLTGEDSKILGRNYMTLINSLLSGSDKDFPLYVMAFIAFYLREAASIFTRITVTQEDIQKLERSARMYFNCHHLFRHVNLTTWTIGHVVPAHTKEIHEKYGVGLGIVSMQGREAKHKKLMEYYKHTPGVSAEKKWETVFRHEFAELLLERELSEASDTYRRSSGFTQPEKEKIIPIKFSQQGYCYCGFKTDAGKCDVCSSQVMQLIEEACEKADMSGVLAAGYTVK